MIRQLRAALPAFCIAASMLTGVAHAASFTAVAYNDPSGNVVDPSTLTYKTGSATTSTFSVYNFTMFADLGSPTNPYTVGGFVAQSGATGLSPTLSALSLANTELVFSGSVFLTKGQSYSFTHDDGIDLFVNGLSVINSPNQTTPTPSSFTYTGTSGVQNFILEYAENAGAPATLTGPFAATPEPSSILLLGSGLLGVAGMVRRRLTR